jgi:predicted Rossmann-fold nucleotide-binding protein
MKKHMKPLNDSEKRVYKKMCKELYYALQELQGVKKAVSLFGSARIGANHEYALLAEAVTEKLSECGYDVITGGGPGVMEAANRGAKHTESIGLSIELPTEQGCNKHVSKEVKFKYFAIKKCEL